MSYKTITDISTAEYIVKRSKFIGNIKPVSTEEEASDYISNIKTKYWDARHNVYAYALRNQSISRYTDDGEPSGTAGMPVLDILRNNDIVDVVIVVTRYFGGVLLGTGGLVRAYSHTAKLALDASNIVTMQECNTYNLECSYNQYNKINNLVFSLGGAIINSDFSQSVNLSFYVPSSEDTILKKEISELGSGKLNIKFQKMCFMPNNNIKL